MVRTKFSSVTDNFWYFTKWDGEYLPREVEVYPPTIKWGTVNTVTINTTQGKIETIGSITSPAFITSGTVTTTGSDAYF